METEEKRTLTFINKIPLFKEIMEKFTTGKQMKADELSYILGCGILFINQYQQNKRFKSYADFAYFIFLKYSLYSRDYRPLYEFSLNFGFYPIAKSILTNNLIESFTIQDCCMDIGLEKFRSDLHIETIHQFIEKNNLLKSEEMEISYIAPTSFGKSSVIVECIQKYSDQLLKIVIVVPTKSLLMQTYRMIREAHLNRKIIIHDEMYQNEPSFIAIFTQERALRLLNKKEMGYDLIFLDEAHNILKKDFRSILISRLLTLNSNLNPLQKVIYLSPLIDDIKNISFQPNQKISQYKISFNIKEPDIYECRLDKNVFQYNRFVDEFYHIGTYEKEFRYVMKVSGRKNFLYCYAPKSIERLAKELVASLNQTPMNDKLTELIRLLKQEVHEKFYMIEYVKYGVIYLHGKLPDLIKEYLESKFRELTELRYLVANSVILEGMNLPIDTLFIFNTHGLKGKELTNLIGRVNRLNTIFTGERNDLSKLIPKIHFINSEEYNRKKSNMANKIGLLRSKIFKDLVKNPCLEMFDYKHIAEDKDDDEGITLDRVSIIQENEKFLSTVAITEYDKMKKYLIQTGISEFYTDLDKITLMMIEKQKRIAAHLETWNGLRMMDKIFNMFIYNIGDDSLLSDLEFKRLGFEETRNHYETFIRFNQKKSLKENINDLVIYFKKRANSGEGLLYFGESYGEVVYTSGEYIGSKKVYVNLRVQSDAKLVNLAIVKLKLEEDFISFKINKFIIMMHDYKLITDDDYNEYIFGTTDRDKIALSKIGLNVSLITRLERDKQLKNLVIDDFNNLRSTPEFDDFRSSINDFYRFEIDRFVN